jgi:hypothetical protein
LLVRSSRPARPTWAAINVALTNTYQRSFLSNIRSDKVEEGTIEVSIALPMGMRAHVDRHVVDIDRHIGAVVEIVTTQEVLVGFALAAVLRDDQSGRRLKDFARARHGPRIDLGSRNRDLAGQTWREGGAADRT